jgi:transposase
VNHENANMAKRIAVIRLIMQGYLGIQVAQLLNIHRETVSIYVQKFNQDGMDALLECRYKNGKNLIYLQTKKSNRKDTRKKYPYR